MSLRLTLLRLTAQVAAPCPRQTANLGVSRQGPSRGPAPVASFAAEEEAFNLSPNDMQESRIIVVTSGKGGVGKTTSSANLGMSIARLGYKVGYWDLLSVDQYVVCCPVLRQNLGLSVPASHDALCGRNVLQVCLIDADIGLR